MNRRRFLQLGASAAAAAAIEPSRAGTSASRLTLSIAPLSVELAPGIVVRTTGYNGQSPGPVLRMREGVPVAVSVTNRSAVPELVHWHGLHTGPLADGAMEEGSPMIAPGATLNYRFTPTPSGTRWYHTHTMAGTDLDRAAYTGQYGFLIVEPRSHPGDYDQEVFLAVHHWEPTLMHGQEDAAACPQVAYRYASFNDKLLGAAEPLRVRPGQRVLFHVLNASATEEVLLSLPGHRFTVVALDGNPVPNPSSVEVLSLAVAERVDAIVEMKTPGNWILGSLDEAERTRGLGLRIEYANRTGLPQWKDPDAIDWSYSHFGGPAGARPEADHTLEMLFEKRPGAEDGIERWTINGQSFPEVAPLTLHRGRRYRLRMMNATNCAHPVHLHRHSFELTRVNQRPVSGILKDTVRLDRYNVVEADFLADNPGETLFHCHQQFHMDHGYMQLLRYSST